MSCSTSIDTLITYFSQSTGQLQVKCKINPNITVIWQFPGETHMSRANGFCYCGLIEKWNFSTATFQMKITNRHSSGRNKKPITVNIDLSMCQIAARIFWSVKEPSKYRWFSQRFWFTEPTKEPNNARNSSRSGHKKFDPIVLKRTRWRVVWLVEKGCHYRFRTYW